jgi:hypothetical protein
MAKPVDVLQRRCPCGQCAIAAFSEIAFLRIRDSDSTEYGFWISSKP